VFSYETLFPMHVLSLSLALKGTYLHVLTCVWPALCCSR